MGKLAKTGWMMDFVMNQVLIVYIQQHAGSTPYLQVTAFLLGK